MLLALFLVDLAGGMCLLLPLVGRRNAGVKFYRLVLAIGATLASGAAVAHLLAGRRDLALADAAVVAMAAVLLVVLRYPKRFVFRASAALFAAACLFAAVIGFDAAVAPLHFGWSLAGALVSMALLGSVTLAMTLGHWYLVVRGMPIEPLKRLTLATLVAAVARVVLVAAAVAAVWMPPVLTDVFFWMRAGWGLLGPLALFPLVWGTVRLRSTMAATGILYVDVVAVFIGEILGGWLSALSHVPL